MHAASLSLDAIDWDRAKTDPMNFFLLSTYANTEETEIVKCKHRICYIMLTSSNQLGAAVMVYKKEDYERKNRNEDHKMRVKREGVRDHLLYQFNFIFC